jgi:hypothetical protein
MSMAKKIKLPKRILGLRIPKALRRSKTIEAILSSPLGREIVAGALVAAAGAMATALVENREDLARAGKKGGRTAAGVADLSRRTLKSGARAFSEEIGSAIHKIIPFDDPKKMKKKARGWAK